ncbi:MAG: hypothetical protein ORN98_07005 [Alphaproteobacteria bacterium]|nr:hypothetical protein [Alphaproteobacteria bacterium]
MIDSSQHHTPISRLNLAHFVKNAQNARKIGRWRRVTLSVMLFGLAVMGLQFGGLHVVLSKLQAAPSPSATNTKEPNQTAKNLLQKLEAAAINGAVFPSENAIQSVNPTFSIYRLVESRSGELLLAYGYVTRERQSVYRVWSLTAKTLRFEILASPTDSQQIMAKLRDFLTPQTAISWPIRSLLTPLPVSAERKVVLHNEGVCGGPYRYWLEWQPIAVEPSPKIEQRDKPIKPAMTPPSIGYMAAYRVEDAVSYLIPPGCPLTQGSEEVGENISRSIQGKNLSLNFAQAVLLGNGSILAFAANAPLMLRFDANGRTGFNDRQAHLKIIPMSSAIYTGIINNSRAALGKFGTLPLLERFEANFNRLFP